MVKNSISSEYGYSPQERQAFLLLNLLLTTQPIRTQDLCRSLDRSHSTILSDLKTAEKWLTEKGISLIKKPRVGLYCQGDEVNRRQLILDILIQNLGTENLLRYADQGLEPPDRVGLLLAGSLLSLQMAQLIFKGLERLEPLLNRPIDDDSLAELMVRLAIAFCRGFSGCSPVLDDPNADYIPQTAEYAAARLVLDEVQSEGRLLPEEEIVCFTYYLMGAKVTLPYIPIDPKVEDEPLLEVTRKMIADIAHIYNADFGNRYPEVEQAIFTHLKPAAHRLRFGMYHRNPLYDQIVSSYNSLFINTRIVCRHLEEYLGCPMNEHEVSFITLHFGAALRKINLRISNLVRVLVVCDANADSSFARQIEKRFNVELLAILSAEEAASADKSGVDYIITTLPLLEEEIPCIQVNPQFGEEDLQKISQILPRRILPRERYDREVAAAYHLLEEKERLGSVPDRLKELYHLLSQLMNSPPAPTDDNSVDDPSLCDLLTADRINTLACGSSWREAIRASAALLEGQKVIAPSYKEAIIHYMERFGPYMVMLPGIALAHAAPEDGALQLGMSLTLLEQPVRFGYQDHDPVSIIFILSAMDGKAHLKALEQLFHLLKDKDNLEILHRCNKEEILQCVARYSV